VSHGSTDLFDTSYDLTPAAGASATIVHFVVAAATTADASAPASPPSGAVAGLTATQLATLVSFQIDVTSSTTTTLLAYQRNLSRTGNGAIDGTGNWLDDVVVGNSYGNLLDGGAGADTMSGGAGNDTYWVDDIGDVVKESAGGGIDGVVSSISYKLGADVETPTLIGTTSIGAGNDTMLGGAGNDVLFGGAGRDVLTGEVGADRFVYGAVGDSSSSVRGVITDFDAAGGDRIDLSAIDARLGAGTADDAFVFIGSTTFSGVAGQLRFAGNTLMGDVDGDGGADFAVTLTGVSSLAKANLVS
jgi:serralysin